MSELLTKRYFSDRT